LPTSRSGTPDLTQAEIGISSEAVANEEPHFGE